MTTGYDPDAEYVASQMQKIHDIFSEMENHLSGKPKYSVDYQPPLSHTTSSPSWAMPQQSKSFASLPNNTPPSAPVAFSPRRLEHLSKIKELKDGIHRTSVVVKSGGSLFKTGRDRWCIRVLLVACIVTFIGVAIWVSLEVSHLIFFRRS
jgi:hypothetical protein